MCYGVPKENEFVCLEAVLETLALRSMLYLVKYC